MFVADVLSRLCYGMAGHVDLGSALFKQNLPGGTTKARGVLAELLDVSHQRLVQSHHVLRLGRPSLVLLPLRYILGYGLGSHCSIL